MTNRESAKHSSTGSGGSRDNSVTRSASLLLVLSLLPLPLVLFSLSLLLLLVLRVLSELLLLVALVPELVSIADAILMATGVVLVIASPPLPLRNERM